MNESQVDKKERTLTVHDEGMYKSEITVSIESLYSEASIADLEELTEFFYNAKIEDSTPIPLYQTILPHLIYTNNGALLDGLLLYKQLAEHVNLANVDILKYTGNEPKYLYPLEDICDNYEIEFVADKMPLCKIYLMKDLAKNVGKFFIFLIAQIVATIRNCVGKNPIIDPVIVLPYPGRADRILPVLEKLTCRFTLLTQSHPHISRVLRQDTSSTYGKYKPELFSQVSQARTIPKQVYAVGSMFYDYFVSHTMSTNLDEEIEKQHGIQMPRSICRAYLQGLSGNIRDLCFGFIVRDVIRKQQCEKMLICGLHPRERCISLLASDTDIDIRYLPHSVESQVEAYPPVSATQYVSSEDVARHLNSREYSRQVKLETTGFPFLQNIDNKRVSEKKRSSGETPQILIATQDRSDIMRLRFIKQALHGLSAFQDNIQRNISIVIKLHPNEEESFYHNLLDSMELDIIDNIDVVDYSLYKFIRSSAAVLTMNSNVGLEAMILNTACININLFNPVSPVYLYSSEGPVPVLKTPSDVEKFFSQLEIKDVEYMSEKQSEYAHAQFIKPDAANVIANDLCS